MLAIQFRGNFLEKFTYTVVVLGTGLLNDLCADLLGELMRFFEVYLSLVSEVALIANEGNYQIADIRVLFKVFDPVFGRVEAFPEGGVVDDDGCSCVLVVHPSQTSEFLLACRVPQVQLNLLTLTRDVYEF